MKEAVIVTGSSGLIGTAVCDCLAQQHMVFGFDRPGAPHPPPSAHNIPCDLTLDDSVRGALVEVARRHGRRIASVVHLAAYYDFSGEPSEMYEKVTVRGTERLLRELRSFELEQFLFSSTMLVHAPCEPGQRINEDWPVEPKWDYPRSKVATEAVIRAERGATPAVMLRIAGVYNDWCHSIPIANQIQRISERWLTSRVFPGDISHGQAFVHLDDVVEAVGLAVQKRQELGPEVPLLIGEEQTPSYDRLQKAIAYLIHKEGWETRQIPKSLAKAGAWVQDQAAALPAIEEPFIKPWMIDLADDHYELDTSRAKTMLGWRARRTLETTLPVMIEHLRRDPEAFYRENNLKGSPMREHATSSSGQT